MARRPNEKRNNAFEDYKKGESLDKIKKKYGVSLATVNRWKYIDGWDDKINNDDKFETVQKILNKTDLSANQRQFVFYFLRYNNATKAYLRTYNCQYDSAMANGNRLLNNKNVKKALEMVKAQQSADIYLDANDIINREINMLTASVDDYLEIETVEKEKTDSKGKPVLDATGEPITTHYNNVYIKDAKNKDWSLVNKFKIDHGSIEIELPDKIKLMKDISEKLPQHAEYLKARTKKMQYDAQISKYKAEMLDPNNDGVMSPVKQLLDAIDAGVKDDKGDEK